MTDQAQTPGAGERYTVPRDAHRRRIQALGAALSRRDWGAADLAHAEIRDAFDRPDIYDPAALAAQPPKEGGAGAPLLPTTAMIAAWLGRPEAVVRTSPEVVDGFVTSYLRMMKAAHGVCGATEKAPDLYNAGRLAGMLESARIVRDDFRCRWFKTDGNTERQAAAHAIEARTEEYAALAAAPTPPAGEDGGGDMWPLRARVWTRTSVEPHEKVLEIAGSINDTAFTCRHTQPIWVADEDVPGLPERYRCECDEPAPTPQPDDLGKLSAAVAPFAACVSERDGRSFIGTRDLTDAHWITLAEVYRAGRLVPAPAAPQATKEPVAWAWDARWSDTGNVWARSIGYARPADSGRIRDLRPLYAAPAASRIGVSEEEIARVIWESRHKRYSGIAFETAKTFEVSYAQSHFKASVSAVYDDARAILALLAAPRAGGEMGDGWKPIAEVIAHAKATNDEWIKPCLFGKWRPWGFEQWVGQCDAGEWWLGRNGAGGCEDCDIPDVCRPLPAPPADQNASQGEGR